MNAEDSARDPATLAEVTRVHARLRGERAALVFGERETSWARLDALTSRVANALLENGVEAGTRVAVLADDSDHVYELVLGVGKARAVVMGINGRLAPREIRFILDDGGAELLFVGEAYFDKVEAIRDELESVREFVALDGEHPEWTPYTEWRAAGSPVDPGLVADPDEVVAQMYTSGTTGLPKGVMLANRSFSAVVRSMREVGDPWIGWSEDDVSLYALPSFHIGGLWWALTGMNAGCRNVIVPRFDPRRTLELIEEHRVTKVCLVPAMIQMCLSEPSARERDLSSLTHVVYGGSPIPAPTLREGLEVFGCGFAQIYGLTETGNTAVCLRPEDHVLGHERMTAAGKPYPGVELKVIDEAGEPLPPRAIGEVCLRSPANMVGYWNRPDATAETLRDGWVHTGDGGYTDEEGYVYVCDRMKDMILYAGENVYPAEIESVLCEHPAVLEAAVIGVPDDRWGELVKALVVLGEGASVSAAELIEHARRDLADFKVPKSVEFVGPLPRTPSGKIKKAELRKPYWEGRERQVN